MVDFRQTAAPQVIDEQDRIIAQPIGELRTQLVDKKVSIELTDGAREWLAQEGYDPKFGARPMRRLIEREIKKPLVDAILFGALQNGGVARVEAPEADTEPAREHLKLVPMPSSPAAPAPPAPVQ